MRPRLFCYESFCSLSSTGVRHHPAWESLENSSQNSSRENLGWRAPVALPILAFRSAKKVTSYPDSILPCGNLLRGAGRVVGASGASKPRRLFRECPDFIPRFDSAVESLTVSAERLGWWYRNARGSYSAVCKRNIPMQGDVAPKATVCSCRKLSTKIALRGCSLFALPSKGNLYPFSLKVFEDS